MKTLVSHIGIIGLLLITATPATAADASQPDPADARLAAMERLAHWTGTWEGSGWSMSGPGQQHDFVIRETVRPRLDGRVLLVEGLGRSPEPDGTMRVTHQAMGLVYYDPEAGRYNFQTHDLRGGANEVELEIDEDGTMRWGMTDDRSGVELRFEIRVEDDIWRETGEVSLDGGTHWFPMLDMTLERQADPTG